MLLLEGYENDKIYKRSQHPVCKGLIAFAEAIRNWVPVQIQEQYIAVHRLRVRERLYPDVYRRATDTLQRLELEYGYNLLRLTRTELYLSGIWI